MCSTYSSRTCALIAVLACAFVPVHAALPQSGRVVSQDDSSSLRLTVRPASMATATQTISAGKHLVPGLQNCYVYVPASAVGDRRVPLVVMLHPAAGEGLQEIEQAKTLADKYGVIVLAPSSSAWGEWDFVGLFHHGKGTESGIQVPPFESIDIPKIDVALRYVLQNYAVDPARIALMGFSDGGSISLLLGRANLDIFSRIVGLSAMIPYDGNGVANPATQFLLAGGISENMVPQTLKLAQVLRHAGNPVLTLLGLRGHTKSPAEEAFAWQWLAQSWADSAVTTRENAHALAPADSGPLLTQDAVARMTTFWSRFVEEPDYIATDGRMAHQVPRWFSIGAEPVSTLMTDMPALAAAYPSVAADLQAAGLTAPQEESYRLAMFRALCAREAARALQGPLVALGKDLPLSVIAPNSVLGKNMAALQTYAAEFSALNNTGIWKTP